MKDLVRKSSQPSVPAPTVSSPKKNPVSVNVSGKTLENSIARVLQAENLTSESNECRALKKLFSKEDNKLATEDLQKVSEEFGIAQDKMFRLLQQ